MMEYSLVFSYYRRDPERERERERERESFCCCCCFAPPAPGPWGEFFVIFGKEEEFKRRHKSTQKATITRKHIVALTEKNAAKERNETKSGE